VAELDASPAVAGLDAPLEIGAATLAAADPTARLWVAPFRGRAAEVAARLGLAALPVGSVATAGAGLSVIWCGLDQWLLEGAGADAALAERLADAAAVVDQSDGWATLTLRGPDATAALARLVPIDLDPSVFPPCSAARTQLRHVATLLTAEVDGFALRVGRSFAETAAEEIAEVLRAVAARAG
jgi:sarcosine oxidase subunit gamma